MQYSFTYPGLVQALQPGILQFKVGAIPHYVPLLIGINRPSQTVHVAFPAVTVHVKQFLMKSKHLKQF